MFKYWSLKKYGTKFLPALEKQFGQLDFYTPSQVRSTVYCKDFDPQFLPLAYLLFVEPKLLNELFQKEFPQIDIEKYKREIVSYLEKKSYAGYLSVLQNIAA